LVKGAGCQTEPAIRPIWVIYTGLIGFNPRRLQGPKRGWAPMQRTSVSMRNLLLLLLLLLLSVTQWPAYLLQTFTIVKAIDVMAVDCRANTLTLIHQATSRNLTTFHYGT